jgi:LexA-binding, inner membrane-associated putative hydrolase
MNKTWHQIGCVVLCSIAIYSNQYLLLPGIVVGSFFPDLDCRSGSYIRQKLPLLGKLYNKLPSNRLFGKYGVNHRSLLLHSIYTLLAILTLTYIFKNQLLLGLFIGIAGHLILDRRILT